MRAMGRGWCGWSAAALVIAGLSPAAAWADPLDQVFDVLAAPVSGGSATERLTDALEENGALTPEQAEEIRQAERFSFGWGGRIQLTGILFDGDDYVEGVPGDPNLRTGFALSSARLYGNGQAYFPWLRYGMSVEFAEADGPSAIDVQLLDAFLAFDVIPYHSIVLGVEKVPFSRQNMQSSSRLQFQNRSIVVKELEDRFFDREIGIAIGGRIPLADDLLIVKYGVGIYNGSGGSGLQGDLNDGKLIALRGAVDLFRDMSEEESDLEAGPFGVSLGGGFFTNDDVAAQPTGWTIDGAVKFLGFAVTGGYIEVDYEPDLNERIAVPDFASDFKSKGWYTQGGFMIVPEMVELIVRYDEYDGNDQVKDNQDVSAVTGGANLYLAGHGLKFGLEYVARMEDEGAKLDNDTVMLRTQLRF